MTRQELFAILRPYVMSVTGVDECILADPNATAPEGNYCSIEPFSTIVEVGTGGQSQTEVDALDGNTDYKDIEVTVKTCLNVTTSINFYRGDARDQANKIRQMDKLPSFSDVLLVNGIGWLSTGVANNLTTLNQGQQEPRFQIDIELLLEETMSETVQAIYTVGVEVYDENNNQIASYDTD